MGYLLIRSVGETALLADGWRTPREEVASFREAAALVAELRGRAQAQETAGREAGFEQGLAEGRRQAAREAADTLARVAAEADRERQRLRQELGGLLVEAMRRIATGLGSEVLTPALVERAVRDVLPAPRVTVRVASAHAAAVAQRLHALPAAVEVVPDDMLGPQDCAIETDHGGVQADLEVQLAALKRAFDRTLAEAAE